MSKLQEDNQVSHSPSSDSPLMEAARDVQLKSVEYQLALQRLEELKSSPQALRSATQGQNKTNDEICSGCGHPRRRHLWGTGACVGRIPHPGDNPGSSHCRCPGFGHDSVAVDNHDDSMISTMPDRRDNRDPEEVWKHEQISRS
jgi:hypothetical protein